MPLAICRDDPGEGTASVDSRTYAVMYFKDFEKFLLMLAEHEIDKTCP
tara:strand:- start:1064 stop:1207 length:144 start_codon:yes stop_codon:yes gene_type:complete